MDSGMESGMDSAVEDLAAAARRCVPGWLVRCVLQTVARRGMSAEALAGLRADAEAMRDVAAPVVLAELDALLATDVDAQTSNPLSVLRAATRHPTQVLARHGVAPAVRDEFAVRTFPDDVYALSPATWSDVDESLAEPGLVWGAWKAMTVLRRRRGE